MKTYIVAWTIRTTTTDRNSKPKHSDVDYWQPFIEYDELERTPKEQADILYTMLLNGDGLADNEDVFVASICAIEKSTDYDTKI